MTDSAPSNDGRFLVLWTVASARGTGVGVLTGVGVGLPVMNHITWAGGGPGVR